MHDCIHNNRACTRHIRGRSCLCLKTTPRPKMDVICMKMNLLAKHIFAIRFDTKAKGNTELAYLQYNDLYNRQ